MNSILTNQKMTTRLFMLLLLLVAGAMLVTGCESDTVAPQEEAPALTQDDVAYQAAGLAMMVKDVGPEIFYEPSVDPAKEAYTYTFNPSSGITGVVTIAYYTGGIDGTPATYQVGDFCHLHTMTGAPLVLEIGSGGSATFSFNIHATVVQVTSTATIEVGSSGSFTSGDYSGSFSFNDLVVTDGLGYPTSGTLTYTSEDFEMVVTYDGDNTAELTVGGTLIWIIDLDDGTLTEIPV